MKKFLALLALFLGLSLSPANAQVNPGLGWNITGQTATNDQAYVTVSSQPGLSNDRPLKTSVLNLKWTDQGAKVGVSLDQTGPFSISQGGTGGNTQQAAVNSILGFTSPIKNAIVYFDGTNWSMLTGSTTPNMFLGTNSSGNLQLQALTNPGAAPGDPYVVMSLTGVSEPNARKLTSGSGVTVADGGAAGNATLSVDNTVVATLAGAQTVSGVKTFSATPIVPSITLLPGSFGDTITATSPSAARTINFPDPGVSTANVVLDQGSQTIAGVKTFSASPVFSTNSFTTSTGNTKTFPNSTDTLVDLNSTQTITAKTLTSPILGGSPVLQGTSQNYTITITNPAAARSITFRDPAGSANIALDGGTLTTGGSAYFDGNKIAYTAQGSIGQVLTSNGASAPTWGAGGGGGPSVPGGRLTTASGTPINDTTSTGVTTLYYTPYLSNAINFAGVNQTFSEVSLAVPGTAGAYEIIATSTGTTSISLSSVAWTNSTTPPARFFSNGQYYNDAGFTKLILGAVYSSGTKFLDWVGQRQVSNAFNEVERAVLAQDPTASWTTASTTPVQANGGGIGASQVIVFTAFTREPVALRNFSFAQNSVAGDLSAINIFQDSTSVSSATYQAYTANGKSTVSCSWSGQQLGQHSYTRENYVITGGTGTFYGGVQGFMEGTCFN